MPNYHRNRVPGGTYFFTANLLDRKSDLACHPCRRPLRGAVRTVRTRAPFHIDAWVVLPELMHCIWTLPPGDVDYTGRWRALKKAFTKSIPVNEPRSAVRINRAERGIWQRRFWEPHDPRRAGLRSPSGFTSTSTRSSTRVATHPADWPFSFIPSLRCGRALSTRMVRHG